MGSSPFWRCQDPPKTPSLWGRFRSPTEAEDLQETKKIGAISWIKHLYLLGVLKCISAQPLSPDFCCLVPGFRNELRFLLRRLGAVWAALILHRFCAAHLANLLGVKLQIEICVGKWGELYLSECKPVRSVRGQTIWRTKGSKRYKKPPHAIGGKPFKGVYLVNSLRQLRHLEQDQIVIQFHLKSLTFSLEPMSQFRQIGLHKLERRV